MKANGDKETRWSYCFSGLLFEFLLETTTGFSPTHHATKNQSHDYMLAKVSMINKITDVFMFREIQTRFGHLVVTQHCSKCSVDMSTLNFAGQTILYRQCSLCTMKTELSKELLVVGAI